MIEGIINTNSMDHSTFFSIEPINSPLYWKKRVSEFSQRKDMSKKVRDSFYLEFFVSAYLGNKSKIARQFGVPFSKVIFDNPNAPIIGEIAQLYAFYDEKELKRVSEGFYHFYRLSQFWNEFWTVNYTTLYKDIDKRFLTRCAFTFLTLSYPDSYNLYLQKNSQSIFFLFDDRVKDLGFSSIAKLMECSLLFCQPGRNLVFPWDPRNLDNPNLIWNREEGKGCFDDFKEVLGNFLHSGNSMRHEDYSLIIKIKSGVLPLQYSWQRNSTNETLQDKQSIKQLIQEYSMIPNRSTSTAEDASKQISTNEEDSLFLGFSEGERDVSYVQEIATLLKTVFILEDIIFHKMLMVEESEENGKELRTELKSILSNVSCLDSKVPLDFLEAASNHLERFYIYLQELVVNREKFKITKPTLTEVFTESIVLATYNEGKSSQTLVAQPQLTQPTQSKEQQDSKYNLLKDMYLKQSKLLSNALEQNRKLKDQLQESVSINSTKIALSKYFSVDSLNRLIEYLKKNG